LLYLLLGIASVFVIIWGIRSSAVIINPILLALVITITVAPLPGKLKQRGMPGWLALAVTMGLVIGGLAVILAVAADTDHPGHPGWLRQHPMGGCPGALHARRRPGRAAFGSGAVQAGLGSSQGAVGWMRA
jgi:hypothetical protein